ncbi:hypothetical protein IAT38_004658 [Cryptococcus sp. DSM 104549]
MSSRALPIRTARLLPSLPDTVGRPQAQKRLTEALIEATLLDRLDPDLRAEDCATDCMFTQLSLARKDGRGTLASSKDTAHFVANWLGKAEVEFTKAGVSLEETNQALESVNATATSTPDGVELTLSSEHPVIQPSKNWTQSVTIPPVYFTNDKVLELASAGEKLGARRAADVLTEQALTHLRAIEASAAAEYYTLTKAAEEGQVDEDGVTVEAPIDSEYMQWSEVSWDNAAETVRPYFHEFTRNTLDDIIEKRKISGFSGQGTLASLGMGTTLNFGGFRHSTAAGGTGGTNDEGKGNVGVREKIEFRVQSSDGFFYGMDEPRSVTLEELLWKAVTIPGDE